MDENLNIPEYEQMGIAMAIFAQEPNASCICWYHHDFIIKE